MGILCSPTKKARILELVHKNHSFTDIGDRLGMHRTTVSRAWKEIKDDEDFYKPMYRPGRHKLLSNRDVGKAIQEIRSGRCMNAAEVQQHLFPEISKRTIRRTLASVGLHGRVCRKKPLLTKEHVSKRRKWARAYAAWTVEQWKSVMFSDESKFNIFGSDGRQYCRRGPGEEYRPKNVKKALKHGGGSVMVWGCISWYGTGRLYRIDGTMDAAYLCRIYHEALLGTLQDQSIPPHYIIFQQDNDPKHTSGMAQKWLSAHHLKVLPWLPNSPDMSIIEHLWDVLDDCIRARTPLPRNHDELWAALQEEWAAIDIDTIHHYYESMPRRASSLAKAKGFFTKY
jgi:transposase